APLNFTATATNGTTIQLSWTAGALNQKHQIAYARGSVPANCSADTVISAETVGYALSRTLTELVSGSTYHFKLCATNGSGELSAPVQASVATPVIGIDLIATNGQVLNDSTTYSNITVPNGVTLNIGPSFSGIIGNLTVKSGGILTASNSFSNSNPSADLFNLGNTHGRLYLKLAGDLRVEAGGLITMDGKGYPGGGNGPGHNGSRAHGLSHSGYGAAGAGLNFAPTGNCYHTWRAGGGGGYGTPGGSGAPMAQGGQGGASFGASDFTTKLYLGSGGAGGACWDQGGKGGGAIYIEANTMMIAGTISARGTKPSVNGGGGSGGTVVLNASGDITHTGVITTEGGTNGTSSNIGGAGRLKLSAAGFGSMTGTLTGVIPSHESVLRTAQVALNDSATTLSGSAYGGTFSAKTGTIPNMTALKLVMGSQAPSEKLHFAGQGHFDFNAFIDKAGYDIVVGDQQHLYLNASWGQPRNVTVESGGVITANAYATTNPSNDSFNLSSTGKNYGNGRLILDRIQGTFHVKAGGYVMMSGKGYLGGGNLPGNNGSMAHGQSPQGNGLGGAGRAVTGINCYHSYRYGGGGSYGSVGGTLNGGAAGTTYGATDFDTQLYLGSGGGGTGCWERGGTGGGAIYVEAAQIVNEGLIDASGRKAYHRNGGGGSGGTVVLKASGSITNSGKVNAEGGRGVMTYSLSQSSFYQWNGWNNVLFTDPWYLYNDRKGDGRGTWGDYQSWIQADMGANQTVDVITISPHDWWPHDYLNDRLLQYYNGSTWVTYKTMNGTTLARNNYFIPNINARYWRIINPDHRRYQHILLGEFVLDSSAAPDSAFLSNKGGQGRVKFAANSIDNSGSIIGIAMDAVPYISNQPSVGAGFFAEGNPVSLAVGAGVYDGTAPLYQWQLSTDGGVNFSNIDGATGSSYFLNAVSLNQHNHQYRVVVSASGVPFSGARSVQSNAVTLKVFSALADGSSAERAAPNAQFIKANFPNATDGVYWIDLPASGPTQIYCIMNSAMDGGGWMLMMKATRGTTFNYYASYWTTDNVLNPSQTNNLDGDAKFDVMNKFAGKDLLAIWPDIQNGGSITSSTRGWTWLENNFNGGARITPISFFSITSYPANNGGSGRFIRDAKTFSGWASGIFSGQSDIRFYGFNYRKNPGWTSAGANVRWGFGWNENGEGLFPGNSVGAMGSNDVSGGIGMDPSWGNYSAGDMVKCCQDATGINRSARVEIYVR
ncbi:hypothetical protein EBR78_04505, partial [bacterium]|nr:hypothetical protein [bacterium]